MSEEKQAKVKVSKKSRFSPIWIVPIIALLIGLYLIYENYEHKGITIQITFDSGDGLEVDKTKIKYEGVEIGHLTKINLNRDGNNVIVAALIDKEASYLLVDGTEFWIVKPRFEVGKISNLGTIISGAYIKLKPGSGKTKTKFVALKEPPVGDLSLPGLHFTLISDNLGSLQAGSPVYFRKIKVGEIHSHKLKDDNKIYVRAYIEPEYKHLVTDKTKFWNVSGITVDAGLSGVKIHIESFVTIIEGGISFDNPHGQLGNTVQNETIFKLYENRSSAMEEGGLNIVFRVKELGSLKPGAPILYNELKVGEIQDHNLTSNDREVDVNAYIYKDYVHLVKTDSRFWNVSGIKINAGLSGIKIKTESIQTIIDGGIGFSNRWSSGSKQTAPGSVFKIYDSYDSAFRTGSLISIFFKDSKGLSEGSALKYLGISVGTVENVNISENLDKIIVKVRLYKGADKIAKSGSKFWIAEPEIGLGGIKNVGAIIFKYIEVLPGEGTESDQFIGLEKEPVFVNFEKSDGQPVVVSDEENLNITLLSKRLGSVNIGVPVYYKQIEVGKVVGHKLADNAENVEINLVINKKYSALVRDNSKFWNVSGIGLDFYLFGVKAKTESLTSIIKGGVAFATPQKDIGKVVSDGAVFDLHEKPDKKWLKWHPNINYNQ